MAYFSGRVISVYFKNEDRVTVDDDPSEFMFFRFGANFLMGHHGHRAKPEQLVVFMSHARPQDWGETRHRWVLTGHVHHMRVKEVGGTPVESFRSLVPADAYHYSEGYCSGSSLTSITLHREHGEVGRRKVNILPPPRVSPSA